MIDDEIATRAPEMLDQINQDFEDSVLFVGRVLTGQPRATGARLTSIDRAGIEIVTIGPAGRHVERLDFPEPVSDADELGSELAALVVRARQVSGEDGTTSVERLLQEAAGVRTFLTEVVAVREIHPHLREITVAGEDLRSFEPVGPDTFVYLLLPPPGRDQLTVGRDFTWEGYQAMPEAERPVGAYYTVRRWRPEAAEIDLLMVLHGDTGPASAWATQARPGSPVALWGPRGAFEPAPTTDWYLLVADETGLPGVAAILESLPPGTGARVFAEVAEKAERQELPQAPSFEVTWLYRDGAPAGTVPLLVDAVRAVPWPGGTPYAWGGGESRVMTAVRRYLRDEVGLAREAVSMVAYWRHPHGLNGAGDDGGTSGSGASGAGGVGTNGAGRSNGSSPDGRS